MHNGVFNVCYGLYKIRFSTHNQCGEQVSVKFRTTTLGCNQMDLQILRGTTNYGIMFSRQQGNPSIMGHVDVDYTGDLDDRKSTIGYVFTLVRDLFVGSLLFSL
jgi:hypothetical protein